MNQVIRLIDNSTFLIYVSIILTSRRPRCTQIKHFVYRKPAAMIFRILFYIALLAIYAASIRIP